VAAGPPNFLAESETSWITTTTPKTAAVVVNPGDLLAIIGVSADSATTLGTPTGGSLSYTLKNSIVVAGNCATYLWTAPVTAAASFNVSISTGGASNHWGYNVLQFGATQGPGAGNKANVSVAAAPSLAVTTQQDASALVWVCADWNANDGASRAYRTPTGTTAFVEQTYSFDSGQYTVYGGYHADTGAAGSKTVGLTTPNQRYSIIVQEILGWAQPPVLISSRAAAVARAGSW